MSASSHRRLYPGPQVKQRASRRVRPWTNQYPRSWLTHFSKPSGGYVRWGFIRPEPSVTDHQGELIPISAVCRRVDKFTDPLPDEVFDALYFLARQKHLKEKLDAERTYATGAQLLLKLIEDRKAEWAKRNTAPLSD